MEIRGIHSSPRIYTKITELKKRSKNRICLIGNNADRYIPNISPGGNKPVVNNEIYYTSSDGNIITPYNTTAFGTNIVSNTYKDGKGIIKFDGDVKRIGGWAFNSCSKLTSITIPNSVTNIGEYAFQNCSSLTSVTIGNSVTSIGEYAFYCCSALTYMTIPDSITSIGKGTFGSCSSLTSVTIPNSVTSIGNYAFSHCSHLTSITIGNSVTNIGNYAFHNCSSLTSVTIPNSVTSIGNYAFSRCTNLKYIKYNGYRKDWYDIQLGNKWNENIPCKIVQCLDGNIYLNEYFDTIGIFDDIE